MNKVMGMVRILLVGFGCIVLMAMYCIIQSQKQVKIIRVPDPNYVQNPYEAQERLKAQGLYDGKIDGIWGKETDRAYCDWAAMQEFRQYKISVASTPRAIEGR